MRWFESVPSARRGAAMKDGAELYGGRACHAGGPRTGTTEQ